MRLTTAKPSPAMIVALIALFVSLGGTGYALKQNIVTSKNIKDGAVKSQDIGDGQVQTQDIGDGQVQTQDIKDGQVQGADVADESLTGADVRESTLQDVPGTVPAGAVAFFNLANCPAGWSELTQARGRYLVGLPAAGILGATVGTALTNQENRPSGRHNHSITDPGHSHNVSILNGDTDNATGFAFDRATSTGFTLDWQSDVATTGITVNNSSGTSGVAGTNAPYLQLLACEKT